MAQWAWYCAQAAAARGRQQQMDVGRAFLAEAAQGSSPERTAAAIIKLIGAALWRDSEVRELEAVGLCAPVVGKFGTFFFAAPKVPEAVVRREALRARIPPGPRIAPSGLVALARGVTEVLAC